MDILLICSDELVSGVFIPHSFGVEERGSKKIYSYSSTTKQI